MRYINLRWHWHFGLRLYFTPRITVRRIARELSYQWHRNDSSRWAPEKDYGVWRNSFSFSEAENLTTNSTWLNVLHREKNISNWQREIAAICLLFVSVVHNNIHSSYASTRPPIYCVFHYSSNHTQSINQSIFIRHCSYNYKQTTIKCDRLPEQAIAQQSWPP